MNTKAFITIIISLVTAGTAFSETIISTSMNGTNALENLFSDDKFGTQFELGTPFGQVDQVEAVTDTNNSVSYIRPVDPQFTGGYLCQYSTRVRNPAFDKTIFNMTGARYVFNGTKMMVVVRLEKAGGNPTDLANKIMYRCEIDASSASFNEDRVLDGILTRFKSVKAKKAYQNIQTVKNTAQNNATHTQN